MRERERERERERVREKKRSVKGRGASCIFLSFFLLIIMIIFSRSIVMVSFGCLRFWDTLGLLILCVM